MDLALIIILKFSISDSGTSYFIQWEYEKEHCSGTAVDYDIIQKKNILQSISAQDFIYLCSWHFAINIPSHLYINKLNLK